MTDKLLPCPFCGGAAGIWHDPGQPGYEPFFVVYCERCESRGPEKDKREDAVRGWNRRVGGEQPPAAPGGRRGRR